MRRFPWGEVRVMVLIVVDAAEGDVTPGEDKAVVLALLRKRGHRGVTPNDFSDSRIRHKLRRHVDWLRSQGYGIEFVQGRRYALVSEPKPHVPTKPVAVEPPSDQGSLFE